MKIKWLFSPPSAPWYGGFWERMVRSIKELLRKCLGKACVTYEEMLTLLSDCEATINGRPLTYLSDDPKELKPLTPAHFIQDIKGRETFDLDLIDSQHILKRVRYLHTLRSNLRKRFYNEYLGDCFSILSNPNGASIGIRTPLTDPDTPFGFDLGLPIPIRTSRSDADSLFQSERQFEGNPYQLDLDCTVLVEKIPLEPMIPLKDAIHTWFSSFYVFNLVYPEECCATLEFIQR
ncbi:hypothetical protein AVEN_110438-1 [Araneus ventricosus]|uniref:Uncharacterized protein n=1 Tax=Araneus ventricosus TaxID=182803 RepID=A0A4Y2KF90_ARAVE|nr:hypothetical protein AVEN_110438-1 [Araneus ventricosus]